MLKIDRQPTSPPRRFMVHGRPIARGQLHWQKNAPFTLGQFYCDCVSRLHNTTGDDNRHDARLANEMALRIASEYSRGQAFLEGVDLSARVTQPGDLNNGLAAKPEPRSG